MGGQCFRRMGTKIISVFVFFFFAATTHAFPSGPLAFNPSMVRQDGPLNMEALNMLHADAVKFGAGAKDNKWFEAVDAKTLDGMITEMNTMNRWFAKVVKYWDDFTSGGDGAKVLAEQGKGINEDEPVDGAVDPPADGGGEDEVADDGTGGEDGAEPGEDGADAAADGEGAADGEDTADADKEAEPADGADADADGEADPDAAGDKEAEPAADGDAAAADGEGTEADADGEEPAADGDKEDADAAKDGEDDKEEDPEARKKRMKKRRMRKRL